MFSDNFDKQDMDMLVILKRNLLDYTVYFLVMTYGTAARVNNTYLMNIVNSLKLAR